MNFPGKTVAFLLVFALYIWVFHSLDSAGEVDAPAQVANSGKPGPQSYELTERETGIRSSRSEDSDWGDTTEGG